MVTDPGLIISQPCAPNEYVTDLLHSANKAMFSTQLTLVTQHS